MKTLKEIYIDNGSGDDYVDGFYQAIRKEAKEQAFFAGKGGEITLYRWIKKFFDVV